MRNKLVLTGGLLVTMLLMGVLVVAGPDVLSLSWWTIDGGGGTAAGGNFTLTGAIGQADAEILSGGQYNLTGGFWSPDTGGLVFLPIVMVQGATRALMIGEATCAPDPFEIDPNNPAVDVVNDLPLCPGQTYDGYNGGR